ncbi:MFS general substrate transporter [Gymnopus androsaceus JB14]|uniref:MFS general substrate transporter n=1 Tax=Gymnopus androsaceus JB14 TaxID=1447944 RepID=A0A6A4IP87_9AGAR|nr:MFS general substrate transporter [Gymnopus androsaceus JB14]
MEGAELSDFTTQEPAPSTLTNRDRAANAERSEIDVDHHSLENQAQYPPVDKGWRAWTYCFCALTYETTIWGWNSTSGLFQQYYQTHAPFDKSSAAMLSVIGQSSLAIQYVGLVFMVLVFQRYPEYSKISMWIALGVCVLSLVAASFVSQVWSLILLQGIAFGSSAGVLYGPVIVFLSEWFVAKRGLAGGIIFAGSGIGGFIFPLVVGSLLDSAGFRWTLRVGALIIAMTCGVAIFGLNPRIPPRTRSMPDPSARAPWLPQDLSPLKSPLLYWTAAATLTQSLGYFPVSLFIPTYTASITSATLPTTVVLALFNVASVVCYTVFGRLCDSYPYQHIILFSGIGSALAAFLLWGFATSLALVFTFAVVFGGVSGGFSGVWLPAASAIGGTRNEMTNLVFGLLGAAKGIASIVGPIIAASLYDNHEQGSKTIYGGFGFRKVELFVGQCSASDYFGSVLTINLHSGSMAVSTAIGALGLTFSRRKLKV